MNKYYHLWLTRLGQGIAGLLAIIGILALLSSGASAQNYTMSEFDAKRKDTANYWMKPVGYETTQLTVARDTVACYFEVETGGQLNSGWIHTSWYLGYVARWHEQIQAFMWNRYKCVEQTILNYKIKP